MVKPDLKVHQFNRECLTSKTYYRTWDVYLGDVLLRSFNPYNGFCSHIENQAEVKREMLKFVFDLEESLCVTCLWYYMKKETVIVPVSIPQIS